MKEEDKRKYRMKHLKHRRHDHDHQPKRSHQKLQNAHTLQELKTSELVLNDSTAQLKTPEHK